MRLVSVTWAPGRLRPGGGARRSGRPGRDRCHRCWMGEEVRGRHSPAAAPQLNGRPRSPRPYSRPPRASRRQRVSSHATLFQIRPLNRLVAIQFAVLKAIKLSEQAGELMITCRPRRALTASPRQFVTLISDICDAYMTLSTSTLA